MCDAGAQCMMLPRVLGLCCNPYTAATDDAAGLVQPESRKPTMHEKGVDVRREASMLDLFGCMRTVTDRGRAGQKTAPGSEQRIARLADVDDAVLHHALGVVHVLDAALLARRLCSRKSCQHLYPCCRTDICFAPECLSPLTPAQSNAILQTCMSGAAHAGRARRRNRSLCLRSRSLTGSMDPKG